MSPLVLHNTLTRAKEEFAPADGTARQDVLLRPDRLQLRPHRQPRTYVFEDLLHRTLQWHGWGLTHVMNITDVGHMTSDSDTGEDKMQKAAARENRSPLGTGPLLRGRLLSRLRPPEHHQARCRAARHRTRRADDRADPEAGAAGVHLRDLRGHLLRHRPRRRLRQAGRPQPGGAEGGGARRRQRGPRQAPPRRLHPVVHQQADPHHEVGVALGRRLPRLAHRVLRHEHGLSGRDPGHPLRRH